MGRRVCPSCNIGYNIVNIDTPDGYKMKPLLPKIDIHKCDKCNVKLVVRDDDKESIIKERLSIYKEKT